MSEKVISNTFNIPTGPQQAVKPVYLVKIVSSDTKTKNKLFVSIDQPKFESSFIQVKGFFSTEKEDDIISGYQQIIANTDKLQYVEMWLPWHSISYVRSLVYRVK